MNGMKYEGLHRLCTEKYWFTLFKRKRERTMQGNLHNAGTRKLLNYQEDAAIIIHA